jgi:hypothetical protein
LRSKTQHIEKQPFVIPAQAGIQLRTCRFEQQVLRKTQVQGLDSRLCGNDERGKGDSGAESQQAIVLIGDSPL